VFCQLAGHSAESYAALRFEGMKFAAMKFKIMTRECEGKRSEYKSLAGREASQGRVIAQVQQKPVPYQEGNCETAQIG
jgi:hypothetical protein